MEKPNCYLCELFVITWDRQQPYACKGFALRASRIPSVVVSETSGQDCTLFRPKARAAGSPPSAGGSSG